MDNSRHMHHRMKDMGEPSTTRRSRTASSVDTSDFEHERPFKKARYVWQLKGKYHLKADCAKKPSSLPIRNRHCHRNVRNTRSNSSDTDSDTENKSHISNKKINDPNIINTLLIRSNALLDEDHFYEEEHVVTNIDKSISDDIPVTLVMPNHRTQDEYLEKWHSRQMAKSYVDNTINSLMELWKIAPFDATDLVEDCENDEQVEDEGILMAIQSHGLQTGFPTSLPAASTSHNMSTGTTRRLSDISAISANNLRPNLNNSDSGDSADSDDHFLSAAVSVAIQKKGLSSYNYG